MLLDSGAGTSRHDLSLVQTCSSLFPRRWAEPSNVADAIAAPPLQRDVSSGIETDGVKDESKMAAFVAAARKEG
ncbi:MAG: hypothetical protein ACLSVD_14480 [Eggerthellaceae bacterium]